MTAEDNTPAEAGAGASKVVEIRELHHQEMVNVFTADPMAITNGTAGN